MTQSRKLADTEGFEPSQQLSPLGGLANRCLKPLGQASVYGAHCLDLHGPSPAYKAGTSLSMFRGQKW